MSTVKTNEVNLYVRRLPKEAHEFIKELAYTERLTIAGAILKIMEEAGCFDADRSKPRRGA